MLAGQANRADAALRRSAAAAEPELSPDVEEFVVIASPVAEILAASRFDSDQLLNTLSADDFSKLAVSDVADALKFVPGVNVVEGQFAVIRGLEDRYSSTLYNGAVVPSPDPDRQSVQLDLFPADVVSDLAVSKTFGPELPSNSSGGSINIVTHANYPEEFEFKLSGGTGFNDKAWGSFLEFDDGSAVGDETDGSDVLESDFAASLGGRGECARARDPLQGGDRMGERLRDARGLPGDARAASAVSPADSRQVIAVRAISRSGSWASAAGRFDLTESEHEERRVGYGGFGFDLDEAGNHRIDSSVFYTRKEDETVDAKRTASFPTSTTAPSPRGRRTGVEITDRRTSTASRRSPAGSASVRGSTNDAPEPGPALVHELPARASRSSGSATCSISQLNGDHHVRLRRRAARELGRELCEDHAGREVAGPALLLRARRHEAASRRGSRVTRRGSRAGPATSRTAASSRARTRSTSTRASGASTPTTRSRSTRTSR